MSTLEKLVVLGTLVEHHPTLETWEPIERHVYFAPKFDHWAGTSLRALKRDRGRDLDPREQVEQTLYEYVIGLPMHYDLDYKRLDPQIKHVWELKTEDVRLFGWFARRKHIIIVKGEMKYNLKSRRDYAPHIAETDEFRAGLELDEPKSVMELAYDKIL
jgi:hypothetical protein